MLSRKILSVVGVETEETTRIATELILAVHPCIDLTEILKPEKRFANLRSDNPFIASKSEIGSRSARTRGGGGGGGGRERVWRRLRRKKGSSLRFTHPEKEGRNDLTFGSVWSMKSLVPHLGERQRRQISPFDIATSSYPFPQRRKRDLLAIFVSYLAKGKHKR